MSKTYHPNPKINPIITKALLKALLPLTEDITKGEHHSKLQIAKKCLLNGLDIDTIMSITGLSKIEIEKNKQ